MSQEILKILNAIPWINIGGACLRALLTLVPIIAIYIAGKQWQLARQKSRLDLYNKRFETYSAVIRFISLILLNGICSESECTALRVEATQHNFLFEKDVQDYIELLTKKAREKTKLREQNINRSYNNVAASLSQCDREEEIGAWFADQLEHAKELFGKYLKITDL